MSVTSIDRCRRVYGEWRSDPVQALEYVAASRLRHIAAVHRLLHRAFEADLRRLHDALALGPLDGRYWVWSGLLLGWAREGGVLEHDDMDADFAVLESDWDALERSVPLLERAGFRPHLRFRNARGATAEVAVTRHGARFEFFCMRPSGDELRFSVFGYERGEPVEVVQSVPADSLEPFSFLGRTWLKVEHHERELAHLYGDWRTPVKTWSYIEPRHYDVERRPWDPTTSRW